MSKIEDDFRRYAIKILATKHHGVRGHQIALIDDLYMTLRSNQGLYVSVLSEAGRDLAPVPGRRYWSRNPIWDDAAGGCLVADLTPYYDKLRRRFILDELSEV